MKKYVLLVILFVTLTVFFSFTESDNQNNLDSSGFLSIEVYYKGIPGTFRYNPEYYAGMNEQELRDHFLNEIIENEEFRREHGLRSIEELAEEVAKEETSD